jgi:S-DNA-T family DNA segregation ATPase FtsK/SpoIIIE
MIKTNISSRIALTVSSGLDSRIILDMNGAEDLLGNGDMLFMPIGQSKPVRLQGCYISDEENERVIDFLKNNTDEMEKDEELERQLIEGVEPAASISEVGEEQDKSSFDDPLTQKAIELAFEYGNISSSMIMRRLKVGYARAARIVDEMELKEIVPPADGNKPRPLQITYDEFQRMIGKDEEE